MHPASLRTSSFSLMIFAVAILLGVTLATAEIGLSQEVTVNQVAPKNVSLFDGKSLQGWTGDTRYWSVQNGAIVGSTHPNGIATNTFLVADHAYDDFELQLQFKLTNHASGIQIRSKKPDPDQPFVVVGYQADIGGGDTGTFYEEQGRGNLAVADAEKVRRLLKPNDWNEYTIRAVGNQFVVQLNGEVTATYRETQRSCPETGCIALQLQAGPAMKIEFRDLKLRKIQP